MIRKKTTFVFALFGVTVLMMALQKPLFLMRYWSMAGDATATDWFRVVWYGLTHDVTLAGYVTALPLLASIASLWVRMPERIWTKVMRVWLYAVSILTAAIFAVDLGLYEHWGFRIDATVLIYLTDPKDAAASVDWMTGLSGFALFAVWAWGMMWCYRHVADLFDGDPVLPHRTAVWLTLAGLFLGGLDFLAIRGGAGESTANVSKAYFSSNMFLNHAATNPVFSFLHSLGKRQDYASEYAFRSDEECARLFDSLRGNAAPATPTVELLTRKRPNVVVILLESFARTIMETDAVGERVMPNLDRYKAEGVWFENMFANSFRTDRGEVAVLSGFPAQTTISIMKLPGKSRNLPSIARSLKREGYSTSFYYGGDLNFTDQSSYMYATGWERLVWQKDLSFDAPMSKWGWNDETMCAYVGDEVLRLSRESKEPFLVGFLTLSSHMPFDVPYHKYEHPMLNAVSFSDKHLGKMLDRWKASDAWDNLLVVLVADHGYPYPEDLEYNAPLRHRIPLILTGGAVREKRVVEEYASQIDIAATLLGQMGIDHSDYDYSKDIFAPAPPCKFGYYAFNNGFGVTDAEGEFVFDCTSGRVIRDTNPRLRQIGEVMLQTTYRDIARR